MAKDENFPHNTVQEQRVVKIFGDHNQRKVCSFLLAIERARNVL